MYVHNANLQFLTMDLVENLRRVKKTVKKL